MPAPPLLTLFPQPQDLLALTPGDLGGAIIEAVPPLIQNGMFNIDSLLNPLYQIVGASFPSATQGPVRLAFAEALSWLTTQGLIVIDPGQPTLWYRLTRRAANLRTRADVEAFRRGRILPDDLVPAIFAQKVVPLFRRGDYDVAVFQAFKEVDGKAHQLVEDRLLADRHVLVLDFKLAAFLDPNDAAVGVALLAARATARAHTSHGQIRLCGRSRPFGEQRMAPRSARRTAANRSTLESSATAAAEDQPGRRYEPTSKGRPSCTKPLSITSFSSRYLGSEKAGSSIGFLGNPASKPRA